MYSEDDGRMDQETYLDIGVSPRPLFRRPGERASRSERIQMGATRLGISVEAYGLHVEAGERWCFGHRRWCPAGEFPSAKGSCKTGHAEYMRARYAAKRVQEG